MGAKVTFDSLNRLIIVTTAPVDGLITLDVQVDLYSDMKEDIRASATLAANPTAFLASLGGVPTPTGYTGQYYFLNNAEGWRLQPYDADHELMLVGNILVGDTSAPWFVSRPGRTIVISREFSNLAALVESNAQQDEITFLYKVARNKKRLHKVSDTEYQVTVYDDDNVTPLVQWTLEQEAVTEDEIRTLV